MASTNEDVTVLATARLDDGRLLMMRLLPDRGTIEIGWWLRDESGVTPQPQVLEIAAEAPELDALVQLCERVRAVGGPAAGGSTHSVATRLADGTTLAASRSGDNVTLERRPERDDAIDLPVAVLDLLLTEMLPAAREKLATLGFGMVQQKA